MARHVILFILLTVTVGMAGMTAEAAQPTRVLIGTPPSPVVAAEVWLIANRWGAYPGILVATVRNGKLIERTDIRFPRYWDQAFDYKVLVAVSDQPLGPPRSLYEDSAYGLNQWPGYLKDYPIIYLSPPLPAKSLGRDWEKGLQELGTYSGNILTLPSPTRRTIRLEYPYGKPLAHQDVYVMLFGSSRNHCGAPVGIPLGGFKTNADGEVSLITTRSSLDLSESYYKREPGGPAGTTFTLISDMVIGRGKKITVKRLWTLPKINYVLRLRTKDGQPVVHAHLNACMNSDSCAYDGCGPLAPRAASDASGIIRFRVEDLREMWSISIVNTAGQKRKLTTPEMRELLTRHKLTVIW